MALPDIDDALRTAHRPRQKLKLIAWVETLTPEEQAWVWGVFERGYISGRMDCSTAWRVVCEHMDPPEIAHQSMKRAVDAHFARR